MTVVGHRGAGLLEPENTIRSFLRAEQEGVDELELDLRLSRDGCLVVMHDATVDRTTDGSGAVADLSWDELRQLDAGAGESIPLFAEVVEATALPFQAEVKSADAIAAVAAIARTHKLADRLYATSQSVDLLRAIQDEIPDVPRGLIVAAPTAEIAQACAAAGVNVVCPRTIGLTADMVSSCRAIGLRVLPWPVNNAADHRAVVALGADGFATDRPDLARDWQGRL